MYKKANIKRKKQKYHNKKKRYYIERDVTWKKIQETFAARKKFNDGLRGITPEDLDIDYHTEEHIDRLSLLAQEDIDLFPDMSGGIYPQVIGIPRAYFSAIWEVIHFYEDPRFKCAVECLQHGLELFSNYLKGDFLRQPNVHITTGILEEIHSIVKPIKEATSRFISVPRKRRQFNQLMTDIYDAASINNERFNQTGLEEDSLTKLISENMQCYNTFHCKPISDADKNLVAVAVSEALRGNLGSRTKVILSADADINHLVIRIKESLGSMPLLDYTSDIPKATIDTIGIYYSNGETTCVKHRKFPDFFNIHHWREQ